MKSKLMIVIAMGFIQMACGGGGGGGSKTTYEDLTQQGGAHISSGNYASALQSFIQARDQNPSRWEAYSGIGWCEFKLDNLAAAATSFSDGSAKAGAGPDLFAGWAFVLNAQKDYTTSNAKAQAALDLDANWSLTYGLGLSASDVHVVKAENYFSLGQFTQSKAEIVILDPSFASVDVSTDSGRQQLAQEIEIRKGLAKGT